MSDNAYHPSLIPTVFPTHMAEPLTADRGRSEQYLRKVREEVRQKRLDVQRQLEEAQKKGEEADLILTAINYAMVTLHSISIHSTLTHLLILDRKRMQQKQKRKKSQKKSHQSRFLENVRPTVPWEKVCPLTHSSASQCQKQKSHVKSVHSNVTTSTLIDNYCRKAVRCILWGENELY